MDYGSQELDGLVALYPQLFDMEINDSFEARVMPRNMGYGYFSTI